MTIDKRTAIVTFANGNKADVYIRPVPDETLRERLIWVLVERSAQYTDASIVAAFECLDAAWRYLRSQVEVERHQVTKHRWERRFYGDDLSDFAATLTLEQYKLHQ